MRDFHNISTYPPLLREMADDIEQCLERKNPAELLGCVSAICMIFKYKIVPEISANKEAWAKEMMEEKRGVNHENR